MKLSELKLIHPDDHRAKIRGALVSKIHLGTKDAADVSAYLAGELDWEDLTTQARAKIFAYYEKQPGNTVNTDPMQLLKKDFQ